MNEIQGNERRISFVERVKGDDVVIAAFKDPAPAYAILVESPASAEVHSDLLKVVLLPVASALQDTSDGLKKTNDPGGIPPIFIKYRGVELMWRRGHALLQCEPEQAESLLAAIAEFTHYERELQRIEAEIADGWVELEQDKALAFEVKPADLKRSDAVGGRMQRAFQRRMRYARIEPHLYEPDPRFPAASQKLGEELREKARIELRLETVDGQLEVFEHIYEMSSQRLGEYRAAHEEHFLEWVIIVLLAMETFLMLAQVLWKVRT
jgi:hypothetical protein